MHDEIRRGGRDRIEERCGVEHIGHDRLRPESRDLGGLVVRAGHARHLVTATGEQRHQPDGDDPGRPGEEHPHQGS